MYISYLKRSVGISGSRIVCNSRTHRFRCAIRGFTLIEVLVVVAIIALLVAILIPSLQRARAQARTVLCGTNMRTCYQATHFYLQANKDFFPFLVENNVVWGLQPWEVLHIYIQKATPALSTTRIKNPSWNPNAANYRVDWYLCPEDDIYHLTSQLRRKMLNGVVKQVQYQLSYAASTDVMGIRQKDRPNVVNKTRKSQSIKNPGQMVIFSEAADDTTNGAGPWELTDHNWEYNQRFFERRHLTGQNIVYLDGHLAFHKLLEGDQDRLGKKQMGLPNFPLAYVVDSKPEDYPTWGGRYVIP